MSLLPCVRVIRSQLRLVVGAVLLTQLPALPLLLLGGPPSSRQIALYAVAGAVCAAGLVALGFAWLSRIERIVDLVKGYAEDRSLPRADGNKVECIEQVKASLASLDDAVRRLELEAARDPLTGILNRRTCAARLESDLARSRRGGVPFSVAIFDLDDLKTINDEHGHAAGDAALRHLAHVLQSVVREGDWVARWGGDEFLLGLWAAEDQAAALVAGRVLAHLAAEPAAFGERRLTLGASVGIGQAREDDDATRLFSRADSALFEAKRGGRGRVSIS